jgi:hypothetical protein
MVLKAVNVRSCAMLTLTVLLVYATLAAQTAPQQQPTPATFDAQAASRMLLQLSEALQGHSQKQFLALFDLDRMKDGALFKQQINSFFGQADSIRVHLNLVDTSFDGDKASLAVDAEMEAQPRDGGAPTRRNERLNFAVGRVDDTWKFVDVQPRSFFSLQ